MKTERGEEILSAGFDAAKEQLERHPARTDYPHDYNRLYEWLEDKVFNLYEAIYRKNYKHIRKMSGEVIITVSEVAEYTNTRLGSPKKPGERKS
jgi:hypothetical protein